jgi:dTDP-4-dehydrorhamnose 3,5-epimerase-like enzyme
LWNDEDLDINWGISVDPILSQKDLTAKTFKECDKYE